MIPSEYLNDINFGPFHSYMKTNRITVKLIHGQINTMEQCKTWNTSLTDKCPLCHLCVEDTRHILQCPNHIIKKIRNEELSKLRQRLIQLRTSPPLQDFLMTIIINFIEKKQVPQPKLGPNRPPPPPGILKPTKTRMVQSLTGISLYQKTKSTGTLYCPQ